MPEDILTVRLLIGDVEGSPFYPLFTDADIEKFLTLTNNNVYAAARLAAISASFQLAGWNTKERLINGYNVLSIQSTVTFWLTFLLFWVWLRALYPFNLLVGK